MAINVRAPFFVLQGAAELMRREGVRGSIVNIGSVCAHGGPTRLLAYSVSKGALAVMTKSAAFSLMRHGIRVNQINPGWMDTESEDLVQRRWHDATDGWLERAEAIQPYGRLIKPPRAGQGDRVLPVRRRVGDDDGQRRRLRPDGRRRRLRTRAEPWRRPRHDATTRAGLRVAILGAGRIGRMHAELIAHQVDGLDAGDRARRQRRRRRPRSAVVSGSRTPPTPTRCSAPTTSTRSRSARRPTPTWR